MLSTKIGNTATTVYEYVMNSIYSLNKSCVYCIMYTTVYSTVHIRDSIRTLYSVNKGGVFCIVYSTA